MKKGILFLLGMFMMVSTAEATNGTKINSRPGYHSAYKAKAISFIENGIKFYVYPNGELDFRTDLRSRKARQYVYRNGKRYLKRVPFNRVRISHDRFGRINRVGNVFISYNRFGKVKRIGSVFVDYHRRKLARVGGLTIKYSRYGEVHYYGQVKPRYAYRNYRYDRFYDGMILDYDDEYFNYNDFYNDFDDYDEDDHYYYYKSKKQKGQKNAKIIKRKKRS